MTRRRVAVRAFGLAIALLTSSGCVYYNGVYNAQEAARSGDARLRRDNDGDASTFFSLSAAKAETVLVRHPNSSWRSRALYLAGRGAALSGQCEQAIPRLRDFLATPKSSVADRDRARVAMASCELRTGQLPAARTRLDSLVDARDTETARQARLWAARAALAAGDRDAVARYLGTSSESVLPWELMLASLSAQEYVRVESLLVASSQRGDYRDDVGRALRELWAAGRVDAVERIIRGYDLARIRDASRATMHFTVGDLALRGGRDSLARQHLTTARLLAGRDTLIERESAARLLYMALPRVTSLRDLDTLVARQDSTILRAPYARRVGEQLLLVRLLAQQQEATGASVFLAAEVARDSLRARELARSLFLSVVRDAPAAPLAPQALYSAGLLAPDSAALWNARIRQDYPASAVAAWLRGDDPASRPDFLSTPPLLQLRWNETLRVWSDSVRKLRLSTRVNAPATIRP